MTPVSSATTPSRGLSQAEIAQEDALQNAPLPSVKEVAARCALPLTMALILIGTVLWGGFVTFVLAVLFWKLAGVLL